MAELAVMAQLGSFSLQHPSSQRQGCTSTHRATTRAQVGNTEDKASSQGWDPLSGSGFQALFRYKSIQLMERWISLPHPPMLVEVTGMSDPTHLAVPQLRQV